MISLFRRLFGGPTSSRPSQRASRPLSFRPRLEAMEDRMLLSIAAGSEITVAALNSAIPIQDQSVNAAWYRTTPTGSVSGSIVVWREQVGVNPVQTDIKAQIYDSANHAVGLPFVVASTAKKTTNTANGVVTTVFNEEEPAVSVDNSGNFVVVWTQVKSVGGVVNDKYVEGAVFDGTGHRVGATTVTDDTGTLCIRITSTGGALEYGASVAMDGTGNFVVSYTSERTVNVTPTLHVQDKDVYANLYWVGGVLSTNYGVNAVAAAGPTANGIPTNESGSSVARTGNTFVIAYQMDNTANWNGAIPYGQVVLSKYTLTPSTILNTFSAAPATPMTPAFKSSTSISTGHSANARVAIDSLGNYVAVWQEFGGSNWDVRAVKVTATGTVGSVITIAGSSLDEINPSVGISNGNFVVAYQEGLYGNATKVKVAEVTYGTPGSVVQNPFTPFAVPTNTTPTNSLRGRPSVSMKPGTGSYVVTASVLDSSGTKGVAIVDWAGSLS